MSAADEELLDCVAALAPEEKQVMLVLAKRLLAGQQTYGKLDLATDTRDWAAERSLEIQDLLIYSAFAELAKSMKGIDE